MQVLEKILEEIEAEKADESSCEIREEKCAARHWNDCIDVVEDIIRSHMKDDGWIPADQPPEDDSYILLSFSNFDPPVVGRYGKDEAGDAYYLGDDDGADTCTSQGLYVNAWQPLPKPYRP